MRTTYAIVLAFASLGPLSALAEPNAGFEMVRTQDAAPAAAPQYDLNAHYEEAQLTPEPAASEAVSQASSPAAAGSAGSAVTALSLGAAESSPASSQTAMLGVGAVSAAAAAAAVNTANLNAASQSVLNPLDAASGDSAEAETGSGRLSAAVDLSLGLDDGVLNAFSEVLAMRTLGASVPADYAAAAKALLSLEDDAGTLTAVFDEQAVDEFISSQGLAPFDGLANPILVWMVNYTSEASTLVSGENLSDFARSLMTDAQNLNYRLMLPLMDLDDVQKVNVNTVLMHQDQTIAQASARYGSDYFLTMAVEDQEGLGTVKWNLYTKDAQHLTGSEVSGITEELSALTAGDIARTLASLGGRDAEGSDAGSAPLASVSNAFDLGPGDGFVRVKIENVASLSDLAQVREHLIIYGYDAGCNVKAYEEGAFIVEIPTSSDPLILDGTMARARDFTKLGPWHYALIKSEAQPSSFKGLGAADLRRPNSQVKAVPQPVQLPVLPDGAASADGA